jgi:hypothetical protein
MPASKSTSQPPNSKLRTSLDLCIAQLKENVIRKKLKDDDVKIMIYCNLSGNALDKCLEEMANLGRRDGYKEGVLRSVGVFRIHLVYR